MKIDIEQFREWDMQETSFENEVAKKLPLPPGESLQQLLYDMGIRALNMPRGTEDEHWTPCFVWEPKLLSELNLDRTVIGYALGMKLCFDAPELPLRPAKYEDWKPIGKTEWFTVPLHVATDSNRGEWYFHSAHYVDGVIKVVGSYRPCGSSVNEVPLVHPVTVWRQVLFPLMWHVRLRHWLHDRWPWRREF